MRMLLCELDNKLATFIKLLFSIYGMNNLYRNIKFVGFDLDNTLYPLNEEIEGRIRLRFAEVILEKMPFLKSIERAMELLERKYHETGSRTKVLEQLGFTNPGEVASDCMARADFIDLLNYDPTNASLLEKIARKYKTFLITGGYRDLSLSKLKKIGIPFNLFYYMDFGDNSQGNTKLNGSIYRRFLSFSVHPPENHVYIGDSRKSDILPAKNLGMMAIVIGREIEEADTSVEKLIDIEELLL